MRPLPSFSCTHRTRPRARLRGFNLIQLMIALVIVGVLATVAYPAYKDQVVRSSATEATGALAEARHRMEQHFLLRDRLEGTAPTYVGGPCETSKSVGTFTVGCPSSGTGKPSATGYTIQATGSGPTNGLTYTIDQFGAQKTTAVPTGWTAVPTGGHPCWLMRRTGSC